MDSNSDEDMAGLGWARPNGAPDFVPDFGQAAHDLQHALSDDSLEQNV
jgi:hypothetical protein